MKSSIKKLKIAIIILSATNLLTIAIAIGTFCVQNFNFERLYTDGTIYQGSIRAENLRNELNDLGILPGWSPNHTSCLNVPAEECPELSDEYSRVFILDKIEDLNFRLQTLEESKNQENL